ncbi:MAG: sigma-70 family RNA polymerase sigma factor, partial [Bacillota bacterium]|nr:sigma-70 family RNA polymerase sigma factor [Bacillota bacterium]
MAEERTEEELALMAQQGDQDAEEYLIRKYKETVKNKAHFYFMVGADAEDIVQEGMIGIFKAIRDFDASRQTSFHTFAELCINRQIITAVKRATRLKHSPLNTSLSLNRPLPGDPGEATLGETLSSDSNSDPEAQLLIKELEDLLA